MHFERHQTDDHHREEHKPKDKSDGFNKVLLTEFSSLKRDIPDYIIVVTMQKIVNC